MKKLIAILLVVVSLGVNAQAYHKPATFVDGTKGFITVDVLKGQEREDSIKSYKFEHRYVKLSDDGIKDSIVFNYIKKSIKIADSVHIIKMDYSYSSACIIYVKNNRLAISKHLIIIENEKGEREQYNFKTNNLKLYVEALIDIEVNKKEALAKIEKAKKEAEFFAIIK